MRAVIRLSTAIVIIGLPHLQANPLTLGQASGYNVFLLGNFTESGSDAQGRVAVEGNFTPAGGTGFTIASQLNDPAGVYDLVVGGTYTNNGYSLGGGDVFVGGNMNWTNISAPHNIYVDGNVTNSGGGSVGGAIYYAGTSCSIPAYMTCTSAASVISPISFVSAQTTLDSVSASLASQTANGTISFDGYSTYTLKGSSSSLNVFDLTGSTYNGATINITAPAGSTVIVNVPGTSDSISGGSINLNGISAANVLFNFSAATSVSIGSLAFNGTLLAPLATFNGNGGQLNGQLIADNAQGTTEFHNVLFNGTLPAVAGSQFTPTPEPSTWMMVLGGGALVLLSRRRKP